MSEGTRASFQPFIRPTIQVTEDLMRGMSYYVIWFPRTSVGLSLPETPESQAVIAEAWAAALEHFANFLFEHLRRQNAKESL